MPHFQLRQAKIPEPFGVAGNIGMPPRIRILFSKAVVRPHPAFSRSSL